MLCLCRAGAAIWPGPGDISRKSLVELHFLCSDTVEADIGLCDTCGGTRAPVSVGVTGDGAGDMELEVSVCRLELEVYSPDYEEQSQIYVGTSHFQKIQ